MTAHHAEDGSFSPDDRRLRVLLGESRTIAVVGLSSKPWRASHRVASYLQAAGYRIIPVNPKETEVLGEQAYPSLKDVPEPVDVVEVFRRAENTPDIARRAVQIGAKALWLQSGIVNEEAGRIAEEGGLSVIMDRCMMVEHARLQS
jgi:predicted CoA-binding protein